MIVFKILYNNFKQEWHKIFSKGQLQNFVLKRDLIINKWGMKILLIKNNLKTEFCKVEI